LENLNMSGWDFSKMGSFDIMPIFWTSAGWLKKLDLTNAIFTWNLSFRLAPLLEEIKLDWVDTSNVTDMNQLFFSDRSLTWLDLSNFDTSKVTNMSNMFWWCSNLVDLNMSGWDFRNVSNFSLLMNLWNYNNSSSFTYSSLKKLNLTNTKYTWNMQNAFWWLTGLNQIILDWADTSSVTGMTQLFAWDTSLTW
jgi:surface protein